MDDPKKNLPTEKVNPHSQVWFQNWQQQIHRASQVFTVHKILQFALKCLAFYLLLLYISNFLMNQFPDKTGLGFGSLSLIQLAVIITVGIFAFKNWPKTLVHRRIAQYWDQQRPQKDDFFQNILAFYHLDRGTQERLMQYAKSFSMPKNMYPRVYSKQDILWIFIVAVGISVWTFFFPLKQLGAGLLPLLSYTQMPRHHFEIEKSEFAVLEGDTLKIGGTVSPWKKGDSVYVYFKSDYQTLRSPLPVNAGGAIQAVLGPVKKNTTVWFASQHGKSPKIRVTLVPYAYPEEITLKITPPIYTGLEAQVYQNKESQVALLPGSHVSIQISTRKKEKVWVGQENLVGKAQEQGFFQKKKWVWGFTSTSKNLPLRLQFFLQDENQIVNPEAYSLTLTPQNDAPPQLSWKSPEPGNKLPSIEAVDLSFEVRDDFGLKEITLGVAIRSDQFLKDSLHFNLNKRLPSKRGGVVQYPLNLKALSVRPGNALDIRVRACDIQTPSQCIYSEILSVFAPSLEEVLAQARANQDKPLQSLQNALKREENLDQKNQRVQKLEKQEDMSSAFFVKKVLIHDSQAILEDLKDYLSQSKNQAGKILDPSINKMEKSVQEALKHFDDVNQQMKSAHHISQIEQKIKQDLLAQEEQNKKNSPQSSPSSKNPMRAKPNHPNSPHPQSLIQQIEKHQEDQKKVLEYLKSQQDQALWKEKMKAEMIEEQKASLKDLQKSIQELQQYFDEQMKTTQDRQELLDLMEKVSKMYADLIPDSLYKKLGEQMAKDTPKVQDIHKSIEQFMQQKEGFKQNLQNILGQLESLMQQKQLKELGKTAEELAQEEKKLAKQIENSGNFEQDSDRIKKNQASLKEQVESFMKAIQNSKGSSGLKKWQSDSLSHLSPLSKMESFQKQLESLQTSKAWNSERNQNAQQAKDIAEQFQRLSKSLQNQADAMNSSHISFDISLLHRLTQEAIWLEEIFKLEQEGKVTRQKKGWKGESSSLRMSGRQTTLWIQSELQKMSQKNPYISPSLINHTRTLAHHLSLSDQEWFFKKQESLSIHRKLVRQLVDLFEMALSASQQGQGQGQGESKGSGQPQNGQSPGGKSGEGMGQSLQGLSGKQMAINQATRQLLEQMLKGRRPGQMGQSGGTEENTSSSSAGNSPGELANSQEELSARLEQLGKGSGNAKTAASLKQLAEEARQLEDDFRTGKLSAAENKGEKFRAKLLEAARALEEKEEDSTREGKRPSIFKAIPETGSQVPSVWFRELEKNQTEIQNLKVQSELKKNLFNYYRSLLGQE